MNEREEGVQPSNKAKSISLPLTIIIIILTIIETFIDFHENVFNALFIINVILNSGVIIAINYCIYLIIVNNFECNDDYYMGICNSFKICFVNLITGLTACFSIFISSDYIDIYIFILVVRLPLFLLLEIAIVI